MSELKEPTMPDVIVTDRLTKYYGPQCAVDQLNLRVAQGTVYGLLGRNGAGKTTAIKMLLGMAQPSFGRAEVLGEDACQLRPETRGANRLSGRRPSALSLDDHRPGGQFHPRVLRRPLEPALAGADSRSFRAFAASGESAGFRAASRPKWPWRWPWPPTRNC